MSLLRQNSTAYDATYLMDFSRPTTVTISRNGDLISRMYSNYNISFGSEEDLKAAALARKCEAGKLIGKQLHRYRFTAVTRDSRSSLNTRYL